MGNAQLDHGQYTCLAIGAFSHETSGAMEGGLKYNEIPLNLGRVYRGSPQEKFTDVTSSEASDAIGEVLPSSIL